MLQQELLVNIVFIATYNKLIGNNCFLYLQKPAKMKIHSETIKPAVKKTRVCFTTYEGYKILTF